MNEFCRFGDDSRALGRSCQNFRFFSLLGGLALWPSVAVAKILHMPKVIANVSWSRPRIIFFHIQRRRCAGFWVATT